MANSFILWPLVRFELHFGENVLSSTQICEFFFFFYSEVHPVEGSEATQGRGLQSKRHNLWGNAGRITVKCRLEQVKIIMNRITSARESVPQIGGLWEEAAQVELASHHEIQRG